MATENLEEAGWEANNSQSEGVPADAPFELVDFVELSERLLGCVVELERDRSNSDPE
jgi:hypothetical protein